MNISGKTKIVGIFGHPIGHTLSPKMHNTAFSYLGLDWVYIPFDVKEENLKYAVESLRAMNIAGVNITIPHKEKVMKYLDEISDDAKKIGAVNTVKNEDGKLIGFNTDKPGFIESLICAGVSIKGKSIFVLGGGGASRAVCFGLLEKGAKKITITDIVWKKAETLKRDLLKFYPGRVIETVEQEENVVFQKIEESDILVNATPIGMSPNEDRSPVEKLPKNSNLVVYDLVYNPLNTKLLKLAKMDGKKTISGVEMFIYQGKKAFEIWTNIPAPVDVMRKCVLNALRKKK